jgi:hypothetical protein
MTFLSEHADAARIAAAAGNLLLDLRRRLDADGVDLKALRDDGDRGSNELSSASSARPIRTIRFCRRKARMILLG